MCIVTNSLFEYKGYHYCPWDDIEPNENCKTFHDVYVTSGTELKYFTFVPMTPYVREIDKQTFKRWIDMGMPTREQLGNHHPENHEKYYNKWLDEQIDNELLGE